MRSNILTKEFSLAIEFCLYKLTVKDQVSKQLFILLTFYESLQARQNEKGGDARISIKIIFAID